jgi:hypothetical protein
MKEKYVGHAYGLGSWRKTDSFTRTVYDFSGRKTWSEKAIAFGIWAGFLSTVAYFVSLFV